MLSSFSSFKMINIVLIIIMILIILFSLTLGQYPISYSQLALYGIGKQSLSPLDEHIIWSIRLPRIIMALGVGGALAYCGTILQGVFHNPLVDPHIIGVTSGAAFGGTLAILLGFSTFGLMSSTFFFGLLALVVIYILAEVLGKNDRLMLILLGIVLSGVFAALVNLIQYLADTEEKLPSIIFWLLGSFSTVNWHKVGLMWFPLCIVGSVLYRLRWRINILSLGDLEANALGINVSTLRYCILLLTAIIIAAQVAVSGSIGWIGLVVPHLARTLVGADHRRLLPTAFILGAIIMMIVDDIARTLSQAEIPLGIITALFGAPLFIILLAKERAWKK
ncbi:ABC transporter permease [Shewanella sp. NFH-SH190041]|uniref:FecCD family ABC transporter permease n=1 Tax=Shewanella sp. NFH-SH190041 TaxID=2950245 RepID=UPI0021C4C3E8|nr:iron ABC transporter permease [Shewanella sp. NFH-SH190041]BDM63459.1 ABC transporter permease [Shewanella sp. NFH-SH190041]